MFGANSNNSIAHRIDLTADGKLRFCENAALHARSCELVPGRSTSDAAASMTDDDSAEQSGGRTVTARPATNTCPQTLRPANTQDGCPVGHNHALIETYFRRSKPGFVQKLALI